MTSPTSSARIDFDSAIPHITCARDALTSTLCAIHGVEPRYGEQKPAPASGDRIVGIVSVIGDVAWSLMLNVPRETAVPLAKSFACFDIPFDSDDMCDVIGEMANVIAGDLVARLDNVGVTANLSLPTVARGSELEVQHPAGARCEVFSFCCDDGALWLEVASMQPDRE